MKIGLKNTVSEFFESPDDFEDLLEAAERQASTKWESVFVADIRERYDLWKARTFLTDPQLAILRKLAGEK